MAEIKTYETHLERSIEIKLRRFNALLITRTTWHHLDGPSKINGHDLIIMIHNRAFY